MNEADLQDALINIIEALGEAKDEIDGDDDDGALADLTRDMADNLEHPARITAFSEAGLLTGNSGVVIRFEDGSEFQLTIVQSRQSRSEA